MALDREQVMAALRTVKDPELFKDIVTLNMVKDVRVDLVFEPPWHTGMLNASARQQLGWNADS